mmetsp:Transcript_14215/g.41803  ORF Transcript_14215/g.41803 Transcript_14215/m.41803 type:complete len:98 (+) Transcript_14215:133-426(+)
MHQLIQGVLRKGRTLYSKCLFPVHSVRTVLDSLIVIRQLRSKLSNLHAALLHVLIDFGQLRLKAFAQAFEWLPCHEIRRESTCRRTIRAFVLRVRPR